MKTMRDVAERAGVSITTVSHVINQTRPVSDELSQRVLNAMDELGYQPNLLARSLRRGETYTIGIIVPDNANPFFAEVARGVEDTGFAQGYNTILCNSDGDLDKELMYTNMLIEKQLDGILFVTASAEAAHIQQLQTRVPIVLIDRDIPDLAVDCVTTDNVRGGFLATQHLVELGHHRIGCITGPSDIRPSAERIEGYRQALRDAHIPLDETLIVAGDFQCASGFQAMRRLLALDNASTGVFACNDMMAIGAIRAAQESGRRIPSELSIVGFDNVSLASFITPPLTSIDQPKYEMGALAATLLLERLQDSTLPPRRRTLGAELVIRQSCAPPRKTAGN